MSSVPMLCVEFEGKGWIATSGDKEEELNHSNVVLQLSDYTLIGGSKVKVLT